MKSKLKFLFAFIFFMLMLANVVFADSDDTTTCTHTVYSDTNTSTYHYRYCSICGECNYRYPHYVYSIKNISNSIYHTGYCSCGKYMGKYYHSFSYTDYSKQLHIRNCSCGYSDYDSHTATAKKIALGEVLNGKAYSSLEDLDEAHKLVCSYCNRFLSTEAHTWGRGDTLAHKCINCNLIHSKQYDATSRFALFRHRQNKYNW